MIAAGTVLDGRYRLDHQLARGGFARVFLGSDLRLGRYVAVKVLSPELLDAPVDQDFRARFATEAAVVARLDHPNILGVHDYGEAEDTLYLVMPYVAGGTLEDRLRGTPGLPLDLAGRYLRQAALALDYAHGHRVVHRDVKPQNMLLHADGERLLLADFGIARLVDAATALRSRTATLGTLAYMAPEQFQGRAGPATDVYALGCVLFQLLTGEVPYTGPTEQVMFAHVWGEIPSVVERSQGRVPVALEAVVARTLAKAPEGRFPSAGALADAFDAAVLGAASAPARAYPVLRPVPVADPLVADPRPEQAADPPAADPASVTAVATAAPAPPDAGEAGRDRPRAGTTGGWRLARVIGVAALAVVALLLALTQLPADPPSSGETIFGADTTAVDAVFICGVVVLALVATSLAWPAPDGARRARAALAAAPMALALAAVFALAQFGLDDHSSDWWTADELGYYHYKIHNYLGSVVPGWHLLALAVLAAVYFAGLLVLTPRAPRADPRAERVTRQVARYGGLLAASALAATAFFGWLEPAGTGVAPFVLKTALILAVCLLVDAALRRRAGRAAVAAGP